MTTMKDQRTFLLRVALAVCALCVVLPGTVRADLVGVGCTTPHARNCALSSPTHGTALSPGNTIYVAGSQEIDNAYSPTRVGHSASCSASVLLGTDPSSQYSFSLGTINGTLNPNVLGPSVTNPPQWYRCSFSGNVTMPDIASLPASLQTAIQSGTQVYLIAYPMLNDLTTGETHMMNVGSYGEHVTINAPATTYALTVTKNIAAGGSVTSNPAGINCGTACSSTSYNYAQNTTVTLTASAASGYTFTGWSGDECVGSTSPTCTVSMTSSKRVEANFASNSCTPTNPGCAANTCVGQTCWDGCNNAPGTKACGSDITLTVTKAGTVPGSVSSNPSGISSCTTVCTATYAPDTPVTLTASHGSNVVVAWSGCDAPSGDFCTVTMNASRSVTATFTCPAGFAWNGAQNECVPTANARTLTVYKEGTGSGVVSGSNIDCGSTCVAGYPEGEAVTLTSAPSGTSEFVGWSGACTGTQTICSITMDTNKTVTATYTCKPSYSWDPISQQCTTSYCGPATGGVYQTFPADNQLCAPGATPQNKQSSGTTFLWECRGSDNTSSCSATRQRGGAR